VVTEVQWINQWGFCDGPHAEINNGKWRYPLGRTAIRKFIKSNGALNYELVCTTHGCRFHSSPIPNKAAEQLVKKLPALADRNSTTSTDTCCYIGCDSTAVEWHHFAPYNTFGAEADRFPVMPLCQPHHRSWHSQMDGYQWRRPAE
jgi:hypothetical protein